jgi:hypothetical protein
VSRLLLAAAPARLGLPPLPAGTADLPEPQLAMPWVLSDGPVPPHRYRQSRKAIRQALRRKRFLGMP